MQIFNEPLWTYIHNLEDPVFWVVLSMKLVRLQMAAAKGSIHHLCTCNSYARHFTFYFRLIKQLWVGIVVTNDIGNERRAQDTHSACLACYGAVILCDACSMPILFITFHLIFSCAEWYDVFYNFAFNFKLR